MLFYFAVVGCRLQSNVYFLHLDNHVPTSEESYFLVYMLLESFMNYNAVLVNFA